MTDINKLPDNTETLKSIIAGLNQELENKNREIEDQNKKIDFYIDENSNLSDLVRLLRRQRFAPKSEVVSSEQLRIFNEAEIAAKEDPEEEEKITRVKGYRRGKPKRKPLPDFIPREEVIIDLPEKDRICSHDGSVMEEIGEEVSEKLDIIPAQMRVIRTIRKKYGCKTCGECVKTAPVPPQAIPKGIPTAGLLAFIAVSKYADAIPLYRMEGILQRCKVDIGRGTMAHWMIRVGNLLTPLYNLLDEDLLAGKYVCCDETRVQVLKEKGKKPTTQSYMWVRGRDGPTGPPIVLFDYDPRRGAEVPERLMHDYAGYLQVDGYNGYDRVCKRKEIIRVGCWSHVHRKFHEAFKASKHGKANAGKALAFIKRLCKIEEEIKEKSTKERYEIRQGKAKPVLEEIYEWLESIVHSVPPKSLLGKALLYTRREWEYLVKYIEDGRLRIDNNFIENAIRPFAIGRKNWMFSYSVEGAKASAMIYSIVETAKANGHEPYSYLRLILQELPKADRLADFEKLLPYNLEPINIFQKGDG